MDRAISDKPKPLSGGNLQIPKEYGEQPIKAYLDAVDGWKQAACRRIDKLVVEPRTR